ncbi:ACP S-malonyltransferase [bacterium]|nr:ACP S-malonyltransferase [bacterium]
MKILKGDFQVKKAAYIFPGQGSQHVGMGRDVYERYQEARSVFDKASDAVGLDLKALCFQGSEDNLRLTTNTQPAILTTSLAILACLDISDQMFFAGHSLGEFTALVAGGALDMEEAVKLVRDRGRFMQEAVPPDIGGMSAIIGLDVPDVENICKTARGSGQVWPANYNCPGQIVISGQREGVKKAVELAENRGAKRSIILSVSIPSHCPLMKGAADRLTERLSDIALKDLTTPVVSNCWAVPVRNETEIRKALIQQLTSPVRWEESVRLMIKQGVTTFVEVGPGKVLTGLIKRIDRKMDLINVFDAEGIERLKETVYGGHVWT